MQVIPLVGPETSRGATHVVKIVHTDLTDTAALTKTLPILPGLTGNLPVGTMIRCIGHRVVTAFVGPSVSSLTLQVGDGSDPDRYATAALDSMLATGYTAVPASVTTQPFAYETADAVDALFTAVGANLSVLTAGEVHVFLQAVPLSEFNEVP